MNMFIFCSTQCCTQCTQCCALLRRNACTQCWNSVGIRTNTLHFYFAPTLFVCIFLLWSNILSQKPYFPLDLLHLSQQASYPTLVRECEGDTLVDLEGDMQSALFLMQWLLHLFAAAETSKIMHALRLHKSCGDSCLHSKPAMQHSWGSMKETR